MTPQSEPQAMDDYDAWPKAFEHWMHNADLTKGLRFLLSKTDEKTPRIPAHEFRSLVRRMVDTTCPKLLIQGAQIADPVCVSDQGPQQPHRLDLGCTSLEFVSTTFDADVDLSDLSLCDLKFSDCDLGFLRAFNLQIANTIELYRCRLGAVNLADLRAKALMMTGDNGVAQTDRSREYWLDDPLERALILREGMWMSNPHVNHIRLKGVAALARVHIGGASSTTLQVDDTVVFAGPDPTRGTKGIVVNTPGLTIWNCQVAKDLTLMVVTDDCGVEIRSCGGQSVVGGDLCLSNCHIRHPHGNACVLDGVLAHGNVKIERCALQGAVALTLHTRVGDSLTLRQTTFEGRVDLARTAATTLDDDLSRGSLGSWQGAESLDLRGFTYERLKEGESAGDANSRARWLNMTTAHEPTQWQALVDFYKRIGETRAATALLVEREDDVTARLPHGGRKTARLVAKYTIGYGFQPGLSFWWASGIVSLFTLVVALQSEHLLLRDDISDRPVQPLVYSMDVFLPIVDFGEAARWAATGGLLWAQWAVIALGWLLSSLLIAAVGRLVRNS